MRPVPLCGTIAAHSRHKRFHEKPCDACKAAMRAYKAAYKAEHSSGSSPKKWATTSPATYHANHLVIDGTTVTIHTDVATDPHTYSAEVAGHYVGFVFRTDRGEAPHVQNEPHEAHIWFACAPVAPLLGPYPDTVAALGALIGHTR